MQHPLMLVSVLDATRFPYGGRAFFVLVFRAGILSVLHLVLDCSFVSWPDFLCYSFSDFSCSSLRPREK